MATFWERAAHSFDNMFSLYFDYYHMPPASGLRVSKNKSCVMFCSVL